MLPSPSEPARSLSMPGKIAAFSGFIPKAGVELLVRQWTHRERFRSRNPLPGDFSPDRLGQKQFKWEKFGIPVRIVFGLSEMRSGTVTLIRREQRPGDLAG